MISQNVYLSDDFRYMDENCGIDPAVLMENAAGAVLRRLEELDRTGNVLIVTGKGNNGGDGWCLALMMLKKGMDVTVLPADPPRSPLTVRYAEEYGSKGGKICNDPGMIRNASVIVDCIFGFSFHGTLREDYFGLIEKINASPAFVLSVDIPSGIDCDRKDPTGPHVKADATCTFTARKTALAFSPAMEECGTVYIEDIGTPGYILSQRQPIL